MNFNTPRVALEGHITFENGRHRNFAKNLTLNTGISSKCTTPQLQAIAHAINTPSETRMQWHFAGKCFLHKNSTIKSKQLKHEQNLLIFIEKRGDTYLSR